MIVAERQTANNPAIISLKFHDKEKRLGHLQMKRP
jgi:hypothetical protein